MTEIPNGSSLDQAGVDRRTYEKPPCTWRLPQTVKAELKSMLPKRRAR